MHTMLTRLSQSALALVVATSLAVSGCSNETPIATSNQASNMPAQTAAAPVPALLEASTQTWTPEDLEDLLAPVALYPDDILGEVLVAATNPQEVLDAGSWRLTNESLDGKLLDDSAKQAGFTPPVRMIIQNPTILDMMCSEFGWTQELGQAYVNDQDGVLEAVQRLRGQARDAGNLESSDKMLVETEIDGGQQAIVLSSPDPDVVYVPQYEPETVYVASNNNEGNHDDGVGTGTVIATGLLAFGAGLALGSIFDDDDDDWYDDDYYYPSYYGSPMPYYSHYPYRPVYAGYAPAYGYNRPPTYRYAYNNTTIVRRDVDNYWTRYDDRTYVSHNRRTTVSPITKARPNRPELQYLNEKSKKGPRHRAPVVAEERGKYKDKKQETAVRAGKRKQAKTDRRVADDRERNRDGDRGGDRDRAGKGDRDGRGAGGGDRVRDRGDRPNAGGSRGGDRPKAGGGGGRGGDRPKAGGGGGGGKKSGGGNRGGGGGNKGGGGGRKRG